ncbi:MAG: hypothetical protein KH415_20270 [Clostridium sp.]|nr:hypothetical protein [Clostridium sp.]
MDKVAAIVVGLVILAEIVYIGLIPFNINKIADELEGIKKALNDIANGRK